MQKSIEVDLALIDYDDALLRDVALTILNAAQQHDAHTLYLWPTVPGIGTMLSLVLLDEIYDINRFPRVQEFASYCRLVTCAKESNGTRAGSSGTTIGQAQLTWAFSEAAVFFLRDHPAGQKLLARLAKKHAQGTALPILAQTWSRAVYDMLQRKVAFDRPRFLSDYGRGVGEPDASRDTHGMTLRDTTLTQASSTASLNASERLGHDP